MRTNDGDIYKQPFGGALGEEFQRVWKAIKTNQIVPGVGMNISKTTGGTILQPLAKGSGDGDNVDISILATNEKVVWFRVTKVGANVNSELVYGTGSQETYFNGSFICRGEILYTGADYQINETVNVGGTDHTHARMAYDEYYFNYGTPNTTIVSPTVCAAPPINPSDSIAGAAGLQQIDYFGVAPALSNPVAPPAVVSANQTRLWFPDHDETAYSFLDADGKGYEVGEILQMRVGSIIVPCKSNWTSDAQNVQGSGAPFDSHMLVAQDMNLRGRTWQ